MPVQFTGETHGCYSDSLQMVLGEAGPGASLLELLTGSAFGMSAKGKNQPFFAPRQWTPEWGIDTCLDLLGWTCEQLAGSEQQAVAALAELDGEQAIFAGPFDMGLLPYHPGLGQPMGVDHYLAALGTDRELVVVHDPHGHPYATVPLPKLLEAWQPDLPFEVMPFNLRTGFRRVRPVEPADAIRRFLPIAAGLVDPEGSAAAAELTAKQVADGLDTPEYFHLADFMVCAGTRRRGDAAVLLGRAGYPELAAVLDRQARLIGAIELPLVNGDSAAAAAPLRELAPTFEQLYHELVRAAAA